MTAKIVREILNYLALIATITVIIAGFYLVLSLGNEEGKEKAKKIVMYTLIGLVVILFARIIVGFITDTVDESVGALQNPSQILTYTDSIVQIL